MTQVVRRVVAVIAVLGAAFVGAALSWHYGLPLFPTKPGSSDRVALAVGVATTVGTAVALYESWPSRPRTDKSKYSIGDLLEQYLLGVREAACRWPIGWQSKYHLPGQVPDYYALEVVDADPAAGTAQVSARSARQSWKEVSDNHRLIVLFGDAGQGKTWTLQNEARTMADAAVRALHNGADPTMLELPLYASAPDLSEAAGTPDRVAALVRQSVTWACERTPASVRQQIASALDDLVSKKGGQVRPLIDSIDEIPRKESERVWEIIRTCIKDRRAVLASRRVGFELRIDEFTRPCDGYFMLWPLADHVVRKFVLHWYAEDRTRAAELLEQLDRLGLLRLACVPFFLTMLCVLHDMPQRLPETSTEILKAMSRHILRADWTPHPRPAETIDGCMELGARLAWYFSTGTDEWRNQIEVAEALSAIDAICREKPTLRMLPQSEPWETWALAQMKVLGGLLSITPSDDSTLPGRVSFTHKAFHELLTALYMARHADDEGMRHLTRVWWIDPDWIDVIPHAVALCPSPGKWVNIIAGDHPDTLCASTIMALRGIALVPPGVRPPEFEEVVARSVRRLADLQIVAPGSWVANRLRDALDDLPIGWRNDLQSGGFTARPHSEISSSEVNLILDEIDETLEENAEEYVRSYQASFPFSRVRVAREDEASELDAFVKGEWLRLCPLRIRENVSGPVSGNSPWSISDFIQICRARERSYGWLWEWMDAVSQAISQGEIAVTVPVLAGLLFAADHEFYELAGYVLARERWLMTDTLIEECSRVIGPMGREAAATALRFCESAASATVIRGLLADSDQNVQYAALAAISSTQSQPLIDLLEPLVIEGVPGVGRAVERYLRDAESGSASTAALMAIANDIDARVRVTALSRLVRSAGEGDEQWVADLLEDETDAQVRAVAIWSMDTLEHTWTAELAQRGYLSDLTDVSRAAWADIAVAHASRLATGRVLRQIASDQTVRLTTRLDVVKAMWHRGMESDVADIAVLATSHGQERENPRWHITLPTSNRFPWHSSLPWHITDSKSVSRSDVELLCVLLERGQVRDPFNHPLWRVVDELLPSLGLILRDLELRSRLRLALDHFEHWSIANPRL